MLKSPKYFPWEAIACTHTTMDALRAVLSILMSMILGHVGVWLSMRLSEWEDCIVWVGKNNTLPSVYTIIKMPVTALSSAGTSGSAASVCVWVCGNVCVSVFYRLDWPAVGCSSVHIKSLAFTPHWFGTRCKVLCGSSAFLKAPSRSCGFW